MSWENLSYERKQELVDGYVNAIYNVIDRMLIESFKKDGIIDQDAQVEIFKNVPFYESQGGTS